MGTEPTEALQVALKQVALRVASLGLMAMVPIGLQVPSQTQSLGVNGPLNSHRNLREQAFATNATYQQPHLINNYWVVF